MLANTNGHIPESTIKMSHHNCTLQKQKSDVHSPCRVILPSRIALVKTSDRRHLFFRSDIHALIRVLVTFHRHSLSRVRSRANIGEGHSSIHRVLCKHGISVYISYKHRSTHAACFCSIYLVISLAVNINNIVSPHRSAISYFH